MSRPVRVKDDNATVSLAIGQGQLTLQNDDILGLKVDALVCPVDPGLNLTSGLAQLIAQNAGPSLGQDRPLMAEPFGKVVVLPGGKLKAKYVFLTVLLGERGLDRMKLSIRQAVERSIRYAEFLRLKSIAFPVMGDPKSAPPFDFVAHEMLHNVQSYFQRRSPKLQAVFFSVLNPEAYEAFRREAKELAG